MEQLLLLENEFLGNQIGLGFGYSEKIKNRRSTCRTKKIILVRDLTQLLQKVYSKNKFRCSKSQVLIETRTRIL